MHVVDPAIAHVLFDQSARELNPGLVEVGPFLVHVGEPDNSGSVVGHAAKPRFAFADRVLGLSPRSHILGDIAEQLPSARVRADRADRDREPMPMVRQLELVLESHGLPLRATLVILPHPQTQHLEGSAEFRFTATGRLPGFEAEEPATRRVVVDVNHIVLERLDNPHVNRRAVVERSERRFAMPQILLRPAATSILHFQLGLAFQRDRKSRLSSPSRDALCFSEPGATHTTEEEHPGGQLVAKSFDDQRFSRRDEEINHPEHADAECHDPGPEAALPRDEYDRKKRQYVDVIVRDERMDRGA